MDKRIQYIQDSQEVLNNVYKNIKEYIKDKSVPIQDRIKMLGKYGMYLPDAGCFTSDLGCISIQDLWYIERYSHHTFYDLITTLYEVLWLDENHSGTYSSTEDCINTLKANGFKYDKSMDVNDVNKRLEEYADSVVEELLAKGCYSFTYDW